MSTQPEQAKAEILEQIVATIHEKVPEDRRDQVEEFARQYYQRLAPEDLLELEPEDLYGAVLAHWRLAHRRQPGEAKVRVYSPRFEEHGWRSKHSIVEIVTDDMPFLVDSVAMELNRHGLVIHLPIHPVVMVRRDEAGGLVEVLPPDAKDGILESYLHFEVDRQSDPKVLDKLRSEIERILEDVKASTEDWAEMREQVQEDPAGVRRAAAPGRRGRAGRGQGAAGVDRQPPLHLPRLPVLRPGGEDGEDMLRPVPGTGLGILRQGQHKPASGSFAKLPPEARRLAREPHVLILTKANSHSTVHRPSYLDYIGVKRFNEQGEVIGERRFLGLYTSAAYNRNPRDIPVLRRKVTKVLERAGLPRYSHDWKSLLNILETFPRDELFQISDDQLFETAMGILRLEERRRVRLFMWHDDYGRFVSALVYVPRDRYTTTVRRRIEVVLNDAFPGASFDFQVWLSESVLARLHFIIRMPPGQMPSYDAKELEAKLATVTRSWSDDLHDLLLELHGEEEGNALFGRLRRGVPGRLRGRFPGPQRRLRHPAHGGPGRAGRPEHEPVPAAGGVAGDAAVQAVLGRPAAAALGRGADAGGHGRRGGRGAAVRAAPARERPGLDPRLRGDLHRPRWRRRGRAGSATCSRTRSRPSCAARPRATASTGWCCGAGSPGARSWSCAPTASTCARPG